MLELQTRCAERGVRLLLEHVRRTGRRLAGNENHNQREGRKGDRELLRVQVPALQKRMRS